MAAESGQAFGIEDGRRTEPPRLRAGAGLRGRAGALLLALSASLPGLALPPPAAADGVTDRVMIGAQPALNGAQIVSLSGGAPGATLRYTLDGSEPTTASPQYFAPFLVAADLTVKAIAVSGGQASPAASRAFGPHIPPNTLVWSEEFNDAADRGPRPDPALWTYDTGHSCFGNREFEHYCAYGEAAGPCDPAHPNAFVGTDGALHIVARQPTPGVYTSARLKSQGLFSVFQGRIEARLRLPEGPGLWPAFWTLGNSIAAVGWPAAGEQDIMEHINAPDPDWIAGSLHAAGGDMTRRFTASAAHPFRADQWHVYGILWSKNSIRFYVDSPFNVYATGTPSDLSRSDSAGHAQAAGRPEASAVAPWPFDSGDAVFLLLNLAVGGNWPGPPGAGTPLPAEMLVDYVRVYAQ